MSSTRASVGILPPEVFLPSLEEPELFHEVINESLRTISITIGQKENGIYPLTEVLNGQQWFTTTPGTFRGGFRTVYQTGTLFTGPNTIAHGLTITNFTFTSISGIITDGTSHVPLPNGDGGAGDSSNILIDATDIVINITALYNNFSGHVTLDYVKTL